MSDSHWTATDFLKTACEFERMTSDRGSWTEERLASSPPRLARLQRLRAFEKVFDVQPGFEALWSGDFIARRPFERYELFRQRVLNDSETHFPGVLRTLIRPMDVHDVATIYERLFRFLAEHAYPMLAVNSGILEASGFHLYLVFRLERTLAGLPELLRPIEEFVGLVIDPDGRSVTTQELAEHGWPDVSLTLLDAEWA